jgi:hypothetical protein
MFDGNPRKWEVGGGEDVLNEFITFLPVLPLVAFIVEFDAEDGSDGLWVAEEEIHMFAVNFVCIGSVFAMIVGFGKEQVTEGDFGENDRPF